MSRAWRMCGWSAVALLGLAIILGPWLSHCWRGARVRGFVGAYAEGVAALIAQELLVAGHARDVAHVCREGHRYLGVEQIVLFDVRGVVVCSSDPLSPLLRQAWWDFVSTVDARMRRPIMQAADGRLRIGWGVRDVGEREYRVGLLYHQAKVVESLLLPWLWWYLAVGVAGSLGLWYWRCTTRRHDVSALVATHPPRVGPRLQWIRHAADTVPAAVYLFDAECRLIDWNHAGEIYLTPSLLEGSKRHLLDCGGELPWGELLVAVFDRLRGPKAPRSLHVRAHGVGLSVARLGAEAEEIGYWVTCEMDG